MKLTYGQSWAFGLAAIAIGIGLGYGLSRALPDNGTTGAERAEPSLPAQAQDSSRSEAEAALEREVSLLRAELNTMKHRLDSLPQRATTAAIRAEPGSRPEAEDTVPDPSGHAQAWDAEAAQRQRQARLDAIERGFQQESADVKWATEASTAIRQVFTVDGGNPDANAAAGQFPGSSMKSVACRATLCRLELSHADPAALMRFMDDFPGRVGQVLPRMTLEPVTNADGSIGTLVYLARDGYRFPQPAPSP